MKKALITGITGQDGSYLAELLLGKGYEVWGLIRHTSLSNTSRIDHLLRETSDNTLRLIYGNMTDGQRLAAILSEISPDEVYNLAAQSHVPVSFDEPVYTGNVNGLGTLRLLDLIRRMEKPARFYQASTSEMFGKAVESPQTEKTPFYPLNPYACAKVYSFWQVVIFREAFDLFACNGICFNHESPRRGEHFVTRKITSSAARIKLGMQDKLYLGNLDTARDWGFSGDYVEAMWLMLQQEKPDDYIIATGEPHTLKEFLDEVFGYLDLDWHNYVEIDPRFFRATESTAMIGDATKARTTLEWQPQTSFRELARIMTDADMAANQKLSTAN